MSITAVNIRYVIATAPHSPFILNKNMKLTIWFLCILCVGGKWSEKVRENSKLPELFIASSISLYKKYSHEIFATHGYNVGSRILCMANLRGVQIKWDCEIFFLPRNTSPNVQIHTLTNTHHFKCNYEIESKLKTVKTVLRQQENKQIVKRKK